MDFILKMISLWYCLLSRFFGFYYVSQVIGKVPFHLGIRLRYHFYKKQLNSLGENVVFSYGTILSHRDISIGDNVRFGPYNTIGLVDVGNDVMSGQFVHFMSGSNQHGFKRTDIPMRLQIGQLEKIVISNDVWIGANAVIMANVDRGVIIGAGSIVNKPIIEYSIAAGNPARVLKTRGI